MKVTAADTSDGGRRTRPAADPATATLLLLLRCGLVATAVSVDGNSLPAVAATAGPSMAARPPPRTTSSSMAAAAVVPWHLNKTTERVDVCVMNACEAYVRMRDDLTNAVRPINEKLHGGGGGRGMADDRGSVLEARLQRLDRRLRSVEQPGKCQCSIRDHKLIELVLSCSMLLHWYRFKGFLPFSKSADRKSPWYGKRSICFFEVQIDNLLSTIQVNRYD